MNRRDLLIASGVSLLAGKRAFTQVAVGLLLDRVPLKLLYAGIVAARSRASA